MAKDDAPNTVGDRYAQVGAAASLEEVFARTRRMQEVNSVASERLRLEGRDVKAKMRTIKEQRSLMSQGLAMQPGNKDFQEGLSQNRDMYAEALEQRAQVSQRFEQERQIAQHKSTQYFQSQIGQFTSPRAQASRINEAFGSTDTLSAATSQMGQTGYIGFEKQAAEGGRRSKEIAASIREAAVNGAPESKIKELGTQMSEAESQIAVGKRGMRVAKQFGQDPESQFIRINEAAARGADRIGGEKLQKQAEAGELPSLKELNEQIKAAAGALGELKDQFGKGNMTLEDFNQTAGHVADEMKKLEQQEKAVQAAGGGGMGGAKTLSAAMGAASAGINMAQQALINQPIAQLNNRAQMAAAQNEQYDTLKRAVGGDMSALSLIGTNAFQNAANFASGKKTTQQVIQGLGATATGIDTAANAAMEVGEGFSLGNLGGGTAARTAKAVITGAKGAFEVGTQVSDIAQGVTAGQTNITAYNAALEAQKQVNAVPNQFRQSFFDYGKNVTESTRFMGNQREGYMQTMMSGQMLDNLQALRIDPNKAAGMIGQGFAQQGSAFNMQQLSTARSMERFGMGPMEETMRRMSSLASGGSADPNAAMGRIMEEAVAKGMDSSKAVSLMSDGIASLSQTGGTAGLGVDGTAGITALLGRALGAQDGRSEIARSAAAQTAIHGASGAMTDTSVTFTNMVRDTRMRQMGMSGLEAAAGKTMTAEQLSVLQKSGPEAERLANEKGMSSLFDKKGKLDSSQINKFAKIQGEFLEMGGAGGVGQVVSPEAMQRSKAAAEKLAKAGGDMSKLTPQEQADFRIKSQIAAVSGLGGGIEANAVAQGFKGIEVDPATEAAKRKKGKGIASGVGTAGTAGVNVEAGEQLATGAAVMTGKEIKAGSKDLESLDKVAKVLGAIEKAVTPATMEQFAKAAGQAAGNMEISAKGFEDLNKATGNLSGQFTTLQKNLEGLNTSIANLGGFKTGMGKEGVTAADIKRKIRQDGKPSH